MNSKREYTPDRDALRKMLETLEDGTAVLTAGEIHEDIPTIDDVGPGRRIDAPEPVRHLGFGLFRTGEYSFNAGGAMNRAEGFSWTKLTGPDVEALGYDVTAARAAVRELLEQKL